MMRTATKSAALIVLCLGSFAPIASATDFTVTKTADTADGVCNADCSLREAIIAANANPGPDKIILGNGLTYTLTRAPADVAGALTAGTGDLDVTDGLTIDGAGSTIDAAGLDRVLDIQGSFTVTINNLTIKGGVASGFLSLGGGVSIRSATVVMNNSVVQGNSTAIESAARDDGGGIAIIGSYNAGTGAIALAVLTLNNTTVKGNTGSNGGGIICVLCGLITSNATISGNVSASGDGGGLTVVGNGSAASISGSSLTGNSGALRGGAIAMPDGAATVAMTRSRILSNSGTIGGAIFNNLGTVNAVNDWWGCNYGPGTAGAGCAAVPNDVSGPATTAPFLVLQSSANPSPVAAPGTAAFTADLTFNSVSTDTSAGGTIPDGTAVTFASTLGVVANPALTTSAGKATGSFSASLIGGTATLSATVDSQTVSTSLVITPAPMHPPVASDLDGDGLADLTVWRAPAGMWYWLTSSSGYSYASAVGKQWGSQAAGDVPFLGDIDGDGVSDLIVWRASAGTWYWLTSTTGYAYASAGSVQWGNQGLGDVPMLADMDGDGKSDLVIWRASTGTWYWLTSSSGSNPASAVGIQWGNQGLGDVPLVADFDGDGLGDLAVWRASTGTFYWLTSSTAFNPAVAGGVQWGNLALGDVPKLADLDGDKHADLIVWRASTGTWFALTSTTGYNAAAAFSRPLGATGDTPLIGDLDGDGRAELVVWKPSSGVWSWLTSTSGYSAAAAGVKQWGAQANGDIPMIRY
jgi:CSLREA domain-containing protein